jgi:hypothetical protein
MSPQVPLPIVVGAAVGGAALALLIVLLWFLFFRARKAHRDQNAHSQSVCSSLSCTLHPLTLPPSISRATICYQIPPHIATRDPSIPPNPSGWPTKRADPPPRPAPTQIHKPALVMDQPHSSKYRPRCLRDPAGFRTASIPRPCPSNKNWPCLILPKIIRFVRFQTLHRPLATIL